MHLHLPGPSGVVKNLGLRPRPGFQHLPRDLANVNAWKTMFDPFIDKSIYLLMCLYTLF